MTIVILLLATFAGLALLARFGVKGLASRRAKARLAMGVMFVFAGALHFIMPETFRLMMPPFLPFPLALVYLSGALEILGGVGLFLPKLQRPAAYGLMALLIAVFPANLYVAIENVPLGGYMSSPLYQWSRLPFQLLLIWWAHWSTKPYAESSALPRATQPVVERARNLRAQASR